MKPVPRLRLIQSWQTYSKGAFIYPTAMTRNWLIATGRAVIDEEVLPPPPIQERSTRRKAKAIGTN